MERIIKAIESATGLFVKPLKTDKVEECVVYAIVPQTDDGAVATYRLELRIITNTVAKGEEVKSAILSTLLTVGDIPKHGYNECYLNGGGQLYDADTKTVHTLLYLYITKKSEVSLNG